MIFDHLVALAASGEGKVTAILDWLGLYFIIVGVIFTYFLDKALHNINAEVKAHPRTAAETQQGQTRQSF
jgi:hypothetical protein